MTLATVKDSDDITIAYVGISRDITNRKLTEAELAKYRRNLEKLVDERTEALIRETAEHKEARQEKELLLKELHHRVRNNLQVISSLLNMQAEAVDDSHLTSLLNESQHRIESITLVHEHLFEPKTLLKINAWNYIQTLAYRLRRQHTVPSVIIQLDLDVDDIILDIDTAVPCGLIINELVSKSLKHAFHGDVGARIIGVYFKSKDSSYELSIFDDGKGMPKEFDFDSAQSIGFQIVRILTEHLDGIIEHSNSKGTTFRIGFFHRHHANDLV